MGLWVLPVVLLLEWVPEVLDGDARNLPRWYIYTAFWLVAWGFTRAPRPDALLVVMPAAAYLSVGAVAEAVTDMDVGAREVTTGFALLVGLGVLSGLLARRGFVAVLVVMTVVVGVVGAVTRLEEGNDESEVVLRVVAPVMAMVLTSWVIRQLRDDLSAATEDLSSLVQARDRFVAAVSHELRTPLTAVVGLSEVLATDLHCYTDEEVEEFTDWMAEQGREMADLIDDLLVAARIDANDIAIAASSVDLRQEVEQVLKGASLRKAESVARISLHGSEVVAFADPLRCRQIVRNLVTNALRYGGEHIAVTTAYRNDAACVTVEDDGTSLTQEDVKRVFDLYYTPRGSAAVPASAGLGSSISRRLARRMSGDLTCELTPTSGAFCFEVPRAPVATDATARATDRST